MFDEFFTTTNGVGTPSLPGSGGYPPRVPPLARQIAGDAGLSPSGAPVTSATPPMTGTLRQLPSSSLAAAIAGNAAPVADEPMTGTTGAPLKPGTRFAGIPGLSTADVGNATVGAPSFFQALPDRVRQFAGSPLGRIVGGALTGLARTADPYHADFLGSLGQGYVQGRQAAQQQAQIDYERQRQMQMDRLQALIGGSEIDRNQAISDYERHHGFYYDSRASGQYVRGGDGQLYWVPATGPDGGAPTPNGQPAIGPDGASATPAMVPIGRPRPASAPKAAAETPAQKYYRERYDYYVGLPGTIPGRSRYTNEAADALAQRDVGVVYGARGANRSVTPAPAASPATAATRPLTQAQYDTVAKQYGADYARQHFTVASDSTAP